MAENSKIEWTDHTFNPWIGCTKVGPGCDHCYAERREDLRLHRVQWGAGQPRKRTKTWGDPVRWNKRHAEFFAERGRRQRVFCASLADVFDNDVPTDWRRELFDLIERTPHLDWLLLTKRIGNARAMLEECYFGRWAEKVRQHVWLGATVVNREEMLRDGPKLKATPAAVRFWSVEPMLGDLGEIPRELMPDWLIAGGESGPGARPMHPDWARSLRDQCAAAGVPFLFKQWGEHTAGLPAPHPAYLADNTAAWRLDQRGERWHNPSETVATMKPVLFSRVGKKAAGRLLDGRTHDGFPDL